MTITVYGIKNCNTMKKAFDKLNELGVAYEFFDYKKSVLDGKTFAEFIAKFGADKVVNKKGTTYRKFDDATKALIDDAIGNPSDENIAKLYEIAKDNQSLLKRPIIIGEKKDGKAAVVIGFDDGEYQAVFG
ncbi:ArsC/Spx/MgsR family protein [Moraxella sp. FZLJ2109]|nr:ArsC/Spx/MgsR family protein [Moraxella sp. FZLJ2109]UTO21862.1 arsenate reductase [Moraxella sp. FZLJ2109]